MTHDNHNDDDDICDVREFGFISVFKKKKKLEKKRYLFKHFEACVLFVKTGIWDYSNNKKPWKALVCISPTSWETQKENIFFF